MVVLLWYSGVFILGASMFRFGIQIVSQQSIFNQHIFRSSISTEIIWHVSVCSDVIESALSQWISSSDLFSVFLVLGSVSRNRRLEEDQ